MSDLVKKNIEHSIQELQKDEQILGKYAEGGFFSIQEAMDWLSEQITSLEGELPDYGDQ